MNRPLPRWTRDWRSAGHRGPSERALPPRHQLQLIGSKQIGSCQSVVVSLGALRNKLGGGTKQPPQLESAVEAWLKSKRTVGMQLCHRVARIGAPPQNPDKLEACSIGQSATWRGELGSISVGRSR